MPELQQHQPTSLTSLPDELLEWICGIIDDQQEEEDLGVIYRALRERSDTLRALALTCRRLRGIAQATLYGNVSLKSHDLSLARFSAAIDDNASLARHVKSLTIQCTAPWSLKGVDLSSIGKAAVDLQHRVFSRLSKLEQAHFQDASPGELVAALSALPVSTLRRLKLGSGEGATEDSQQRWVAVWNCLGRFPQLQDHDIADCRGLSIQPSRNFGDVASLPQITRLSCCDSLCNCALDPRLFGQALPNLTDLSFSIDPEVSPVAMLALANLPPSLTSLEVSVYRGEPVTYLAKLPSSLRHLTLGHKSFVEPELLAYLPTSPLVSITFKYGSGVGDVVLAQLTGPNRPPPLRRIRLDHVSAAYAPAIRERFSWYPLEALRGAMFLLPYDLGPHWPVGGSEEGLRSALAAAHAHGIEVQGSAVHCVDWIKKYAAVYRDYVAEQTARGGAPEHSRDNLDADDERR